MLPFHGNSRPYKQQLDHYQFSQSHPAIARQNQQILSQILHIQIHRQLSNERFFTLKNWKSLKSLLKNL